MPDPLTEEQLEAYRDLAEMLSKRGRRYTSSAITALLAEVNFQRGFANEMIAMTASGQGGSHGAAREIRARLDGARENERLRAELDAIIEVCAGAGIGESGQSALDRVKELHKALGEQIDAANPRSNA